MATEIGTQVGHADTFKQIAHLLSNFFLFLLVFGMSATVDTDELLVQMKNKRAILTGVFMQFLIMPFLGFVAVEALGDGLSPSVGIILLVVTSSPGGSYSNWWCSMFNADLALSVAMTAVSTLLSTFLLPLNLFLYTYLTYGSDAEHSIMEKVNWGTLFISLFVVILAIVSGLFSSYYIKSMRFRTWANRGGSISGLVLVVFSALVSSFVDEEEGGDGTSSKVWERNWQFYVGVSFPCLFGLLLANIFSCYGIKAAERVTLSVECCYQNCGIATSVAVAMFSDSKDRAEALGVPLFYGLCEAVILSVYCVFAWKSGWTKAPRNEKLCVILSSTYEVQDTSYGKGKQNKNGSFQSSEVEILKL